MSWPEIARTRRRSARHHRRAYRQSSDAGETAERSRALGNGFEPLGHRGGAVGAAGASVLSDRRPRLRPVRANSKSRPNSASRPRSRPGRACCLPSTASNDGAAADFAQRRLSAHALCARSVVGHRDRDVERLSPRRRGLIYRPALTAFGLAVRPTHPRHDRHRRQNPAQTGNHIIGDRQHANCRGSPEPGPAPSRAAPTRPPARAAPRSPISLRSRIGMADNSWQKPERHNVGCEGRGQHYMVRAPATSDRS